MKRYIASLLALVMTISLAACGSTQGTAETATAAATATTAAAAETTKGSESAAATTAASVETQEEVPGWKQEHPGWLCENKETLTVYTWEGVSSSYPPPSNDLWFWQWLEDYTNVHIEWEVVPFADYDTVVTAKLTSGSTLPDIINIGTIYNNANNAGINGMLIDLTEYWDECFKNTQAYMDNLGIKYKESLTNSDGQLYVIASMDNPIENRIRPYVNKAWRESAGCEMPATIDEFTEMCRKMKALGDWNGNGIDDEVVLAPRAIEVLFAAFATDFGLELNERYGLYYADNGVVKSSVTSDNMKAMLKWFNMLYEEGILDPDVTTTQNEQLTEKLASDQAGIVCNWISGIVSNGNLTSAGQAAKNTNIFDIQMPMTSENNDTPYMMMYENNYSVYTGITSDCKNPELAARWLDTMYADENALTARCCGEKDVNYKVNEDGTRTAVLAEGETTWSVKSLGGGQISLPHIQTNEQLLFGKSFPEFDWLNEEYATLREDYEWRHPSVSTLPSMTKEEEELRDMHEADVDTCWREYRDMFVIGKKDIDKDWDEFCSQIEAFGLNEMISCYQSVYDRTH